VPARSDTPKRSGRARALDRPLLPRIAGRADGLPARAAPPSSAAAGQGPVLPARCLPQEEGLQRGLPGGAALPTSAGAAPLFREGGTLSLPAMAFVRTNAPLGRVPADGPNGEGSGSMPLASELWQGGMPPANTWRSSCRYWAKMEDISFPGRTENPTLPGKIVALKETSRRGLIRDQYDWISPNNGFPAGPLPPLRYWRYGRGGGLCSKQWTCRTSETGGGSQRPCSMGEDGSGRGPIPALDASPAAGRTAGRPLPRPGLALQVLLRIFPITVIRYGADSAADSRCGRSEARGADARSAGAARPRSTSGVFRRTPRGGSPCSGSPCSGSPCSGSPRGGSP
jgi:hypothetical protein